MKKTVLRQIGSKARRHCLGAVALILALASPAAFASNPEITEAEPGEAVYCGDPAAMTVDTDGDGKADTVYLYVGQDA